MKKKSFLIMFFIVNLIVGQEHIFSGRVIDAETFQPLLSATIHILGTSKGTITNSSGEFRISLTSGSVRLAVRYIGYQSDTITITLNEDVMRTISLHSNSSQVVVQPMDGEDPALEIVRRAIEMKQNWIGQLSRYSGRVFNRLQVRTDKSLESITEAYSTLYWSKSDVIHEVVTDLKKNGVLSKYYQKSHSGSVANFNDDRISQNGFIFIGPTAKDAFDYYDFTLLSTKKMDDNDVYEIALMPRSKIIPLFKGRILIEKNSYAVVEVDLSPNEACEQLFINRIDFQFKQSFRLYENKYWLPVNYHFEDSYILSVMGIRLTTLKVERDIIFYDYSFTPVSFDSLLNEDSFPIESSATKNDSNFAVLGDVFPLTEEQKKGKALLVRAQLTEKNQTPAGFRNDLQIVPVGVIEVVDTWFNRVEGLHLGVSNVFANVVEGLNLGGTVGYGFSDSQWKYELGTSFHFGEKHTTVSSSDYPSFTERGKIFSLRLQAYDKHMVSLEPLAQGLFLNSFSSLIDKNDVHDYYRAVGGAISWTYAPHGTTAFTLAAAIETHHSVFQMTNYSLFQQHKRYAPQASIINGRMDALHFTVEHGSSEEYRLSKNAFQLTSSIEHASYLIGGDFEFTKVHGTVRGKFGTMLNNESIYPPTLGGRISAGTSLGHIPPQRYYEAYSQFETTNGFGGLKALPRREYYGDRYVTFTIDHNFRRMLFSPLGIQRLMESTLDLIMEVNVARLWLSREALRTPLFPAQESLGWYYEASIGVANIFDVFRIDVTRRFSSPSLWTISLSNSDFLVGLFSK